MHHCAATGCAQGSQPTVLAKVMFMLQLTTHHTQRATQGSESEVLPATSPSNSL
jgi:hypothetical protein